MDIRAAREYARQVTRELGLSGESSCVDRTSPLRLYIAVDGRLPGYPDHDLALLWTRSHGWALAVEKPGTTELRAVAHLANPVEAPPRTVARWVRALCAEGQLGTAS
ncbi:DUF6292 family protein [Lentzea sp. NPDC051213]|uniref:DUF6292 family protein n=1 Tax=Lentzea sp. NPDC051213 TaxID=3364126 RepID=UPI0037B88E8F